MSAVAHLAGACITAQGRYRRQRCSWCGIALIDDDLALMAVPVGCDPTPIEWEPGSWVEVEGDNPRRTSRLPDPGKRMPDNSCMALEVDLAAAERTVRR